ncbi:MAG: hypothetical protein AB2705_17845, partial [Candidatus Thiodiazotropha sp.]
TVYQPYCLRKAKIVSNLGLSEAIGLRIDHPNCVKDAELKTEELLSPKEYPSSYTTPLLILIITLPLMLRLHK